MVRLTHLLSGDSQGQETSLALSADKPTRSYDTEFSNHHPCLSIPRLKGLSCSKMKWWTIYTNLSVNAIVRLPHPQSGDCYDQKTFLAPSADKRLRNYDTECLNHHPSLSTLRSKELSCSKMKWWAYIQIYQIDTILIISLTHIWVNITRPEIFQWLPHWNIRPTT